MLNCAQTMCFNINHYCPVRGGGGGRGGVRAVPPLNQIKPGLRGGVGRTVISGTTIENFEVEVLGLVPQSPPVQDLIMVRVSGEPIERSGGIALGMSGSPVYIGGRLVGAISHTFPKPITTSALLHLPRICLEYMMSLCTTPPLCRGGVREVRSPLIIQGLNERNTEYLRQGLERYQVQLMPSAAKDAEPPQAPPRGGQHDWRSAFAR